MSADTVREVTSQSWFSRIGQSFKGILFGLILFVVAFPVLFTNEGRAVKRQKTLEEGAQSVASVSADEVNPANDGALVHLTGKAVTDEMLEDPEFGVSAQAIKLQRSVEMYQWDETEQSDTKTKVGGGTETVTEYSYSQRWSSRLIPSSEFKDPAGHTNPTSMPFESKDLQADKVTVGAFRLSPSQVGGINNFQPLQLPEEVAVPHDLRGTTIRTPNGFYIGFDPAAPRVGDVRIQYKVAPMTDISLIARQVSDSFEPHTTKVGGTIQLLQIGTHSADAMFQKAQRDNKILTWLIRAGGFLLLWIGLKTVLRPLAVVADVLPILGKIVAAGSGLVAFLIAAIFWTITVAIAWLFYRPLLGVGLLVVAIGLAIALRSRLKKVEPASVPQSAPAVP